ncbi:DinB family protein [Paenibacillus glycanilyticus]|uniref:DinB family protein n=1 Tax=Paenibacillus glycanilyticus TaxID=126569 RepID=UPI00203C25F0|nr:DinB family protein [Paenibacillus glycanilyticus]MCM3631553.1 DinB family protein [Paenibacillus glycanilyticus]
MLERPQAGEYNEFINRYISLVPEGNLITLLEEQQAETNRILSALSAEQADYRYAEGKWSLKEVLGHVTDTERIMSYRLLRIGRGDNTPLPGFDQDVYMEGDPFHSLTITDLLDNYNAVRLATLLLLKQLPADAFNRTGEFANQSPITARAIAHIIYGHERNHLLIIQDRYLNN